MILLNHAADNFYIKKGDRIAQLKGEQVIEPKLQELTSLYSTACSDCCFVSTGSVVLTMIILAIIRKFVPEG